MKEHNTTTAVAVKSAKNDIRSLLQSDAIKQQIALALPKHITADRMSRVAITAVMRNPKLMDCTKESLLSCLMLCSQLGLEPDGRRAHLIPRENRKNNTTECTVIFDWKGLAELALRSGIISKLHADLICENDEFSYDLGDILHHRVNFKQPRGNPYAAYAMAVTKTGEKFVQVMTKDEIEEIRNSSQGWQSFQKGWAKQSPWKDTPGEMWKKTAFRRLSKWLPLSAEFRDAIEAEDEAVPQVDTTPIPAAPKFVAAMPAESLAIEFNPPAEPEKAQEVQAVSAEVSPAEPTPEPQSTPAQSPRIQECEAAGITPDQAVIFYNSNAPKENAAENLDGIPEASFKKMISTPVILEKVKKVKAV